MKIVVGDNYVNRLYFNDMDKAQPRQHPPSPHAHAVWQDQCRICRINGKLVALPYIEASRYDDYEFGATLAAISANRLIRRLVDNKA